MPPAAADAAIVARMSRAGAVLVGALNMEELAYGFLTENHHYGTTRNPHDLERGAGGSSGGSAAAVGAGMLPVTLGSDTSGSIRVPASLCGVFGLKPTYGRLPRSGTYPFVNSPRSRGAVCEQRGGLGAGVRRDAGTGSCRSCLRAAGHRADGDVAVAAAGNSHRHPGRLVPRVGGIRRHGVPCNWRRWHWARPSGPNSRARRLRARRPTSSRARRAAGCIGPA